MALAVSAKTKKKRFVVITLFILWHKQQTMSSKNRNLSSSASVARRADRGSSVERYQTPKFGKQGKRSRLGDASGETRNVSSRKEWKTTPRRGHRDETEDEDDDDDDDDSGVVADTDPNEDKEEEEDEEEDESSPMHGDRKIRITKPPEYVNKGNSTAITPSMDEYNRHREKYQGGEFVSLKNDKLCKLLLSQEVKGVIFTKFKFICDEEELDDRSHIKTFANQTMVRVGVAPNNMEEFWKNISQRRLKCFRKNGVLSTQA